MMEQTSDPIATNFDQLRRQFREHGFTKPSNVTVEVAPPTSPIPETPPAPVSSESVLLPVADNVPSVNLSIPPRLEPAVEAPPAPDIVSRIELPTPSRSEPVREIHPVPAVRTITTFGLPDERRMGAPGGDQPAIHRRTILSRPAPVSAVALDEPRVNEPPPPEVQNILPPETQLTVGESFPSELSDQDLDKKISEITTSSSEFIDYLRSTVSKTFRGHETEGVVPDEIKNYKNSTPGARDMVDSAINELSSADKDTRDRAIRTIFSFVELYRKARRITQPELRKEGNSILEDNRDVDITFLTSRGNPRSREGLVLAHGLSMLKERLRRTMPSPNSVVEGPVEVVPATIPVDPVVSSHVSGEIINTQMPSSIGTAEDVSSFHNENIAIQDIYSQDSVQNSLVARAGNNPTVESEVRKALKTLSRAGEADVSQSDIDDAAGTIYALHQLRSVSNQDILSTDIDEIKRQMPDRDYIDNELANLAITGNKVDRAIARAITIVSKKLHT